MIDHALKPWLLEVNAAPHMRFDEIPLYASLMRDTLETLLRRGGDAAWPAALGEASREMGAAVEACEAGGTPVHTSAWWHSQPGFHALLKHAKGTLRLDIGFKLNNASALGLAAYASTPEIVEALLDAGANVAHINDVRLPSPLTSRQ